MDSKVKLRLSWMNLYKKLGHSGKVCQHYNISRFTLRKWCKRYEVFGEAGLLNISSKPKTSPTKKINVLIEKLILDLRTTRKLGARRMQTELKRLHDLPIKPFSLHLNGKVERSQRTDLDEFYSSVNIKDSDLQVKLIAWEEYYNKERPHSSIQGKTPWEKYKGLESTIPSLSEIQQNYIPSKEPFVTQNYKHDQILKSLRKNKTIAQVSTCQVTT